MKMIPIRTILVMLLVVSFASLTLFSGEDQKLLERAKDAYRKQDFRQAETQFRSLIKSDPDSTVGHLYLGHSLYYQGKFEKAIPEYEKAMELGKKSGEIKQVDERLITDQIGMSYGMSGHVEKAKDIFELAIKKDPEYALYYYNLACAYAELGNSDEAIGNLKKGFDRRKNLLPGETFPNPRRDDSFKRYLGDPKFKAALREMGF